MNQSIITNCYFKKVEQSPSLFNYIDSFLKQIGGSDPILYLPRVILDYLVDHHALIYLVIISIIELILIVYLAYKKRKKLMRKIKVLELKGNTLRIKLKDFELK